MLWSSSPPLTSTGFGTTLLPTSPRPIIAPAVRRNASSRSSSGVLASSSTGDSRPVTPRSRARTIIIGIAASMQVTSMSSTTSMRLPVGNSAPVTAPQASRNSRRIGAAAPATPSMRADPS